MIHNQNVSTAVSLGWSHSLFNDWGASGRVLMCQLMGAFRSAELPAMVPFVCVKVEREFRLVHGEHLL